MDRRAPRSGVRLILLLFLFAPFFLSCDNASLGSTQDIHQSIRTGDLETVERLLERDPDIITLRNPAGRDPLHEACIWGQPTILEYLVSKGADVNALSKAGNTTLHWAVHAFVGPEVRGEMAAFLLTQSPELARTSNVNGITPLHWAGNEHWETIELLLGLGTELNARDRNGSTALHHWTGWWEDDQSQGLIEAGADLEITDNQGRTALHVAAIIGRLEKYRQLADAGANLNPRDGSGLTPADYARKYGHHSLANLMVSEGALVTGAADVSPTPRLLADGPGAGAAAVWYMDSNAWAIRTERELLVFDYTDWGVMPTAPAVVNGRITGPELTDLSVTVFATARRGWQESLLQLRDEVEDIHFVLGFRPDSADGITVMDEEGTHEVGDLRVTAAKSEHGGTAFLVEVDGLTVFHSGKPARFESGGVQAWSRSLTRMKETAGDIDLAFVPVFVGGEEEATALEEFLTVVAWLSPTAILPAGGAGTHTYLYHEAANLAEERYPSIQTGAPNDRGELFVFSEGRLVRR